LSISPQVDTPEQRAPSRDIAQAVLHERVRVAFAKALFAHLTVPPLSGLIVWLLWDDVDHRLLIGALVVLNLLAVAGVVQVTTYRRRQPPPEQARWWAGNFTIGSVIYGAIWGALGALLFLPDALVQQTMLLLLLAGMAAGGLTTHLTLPWALHGFHLLMLAPITTRLLVAAERPQLALAGMIVVYAAALTAIGRAGSRSMVETIRLQLRNAELVGDLTTAREQLEAKSRELELRVEERTAQLAESRQLASIGRLATGIAHEVNNPLTWIMSNLQFLRDAIDNEELPATLADEIRPALTDAIRGAARIRGIVQDLTALARRSATEIGPVDLNGVLRSAVNVAHSELKQRARIDIDFDQIPRVHANPTRLAQAFLNLLLNAADAMSPRDLASNVLTLRTREQPNRAVVVEICDTGSGIPQASLERIFEPFYTTKKSGEGAGLGLAICKHVIEESGGSIRAHSDGQGATFTITLPAAAVDDDEVETSVPGE
jgi:signal transduction histidine kinase